ncbi:MAG: secondary thiamine-phosphate synthase enzyme YjbQ [Methanobrevibacter sp.]|nr:secondary thiamine-phosphate synthase enzyme YjbQ [Methanobrevibacter sp.]
MAVINNSLKIDSNASFQIIDITSDIKIIFDEINSDNALSNGILNIFTKHSTSAIVINENEKGLLGDFEFILEDLVQDKNNYSHDLIDNNASSHLKSFLLGSSETVPIVNGKIDLGTWQSIFFIELDGPRRNRTIDLTFIGE